MMFSFQELYNTLIYRKYTYTSKIFFLLSLLLSNTHFFMFKDLVYFRKEKASINEKIRFYIKCRRSGVLPNHIHNYTRNLYNVQLFSYANNNKLINNIRTNQMLIFKLELNDLFKKLNYLNSKIDAINAILHNYNPTLLKAFNDFHDNKIFFYRFSLRTKFEKKFNNLYNNINLNRRQYPTQTSVDQNHTNTNHNITNLTNKLIPDYVKSTLSLGEKFNFTTKIATKDYINIFKNLETAVKPFYNDDKVEEIRNKIIHCLMHNKNNFPNNQVNSVLDKNIIFTKHFFKQNNDILVTKADKGNSVVLLYKTDYNNKMENLLNDESCYEKVLQNPLKNIKKITKDFVNIMLNKGDINESQKNPTIT